jgi:cyanate permease
MPFSLVFGAGGPLLGGVLYERTGDYTLAFILFAIAGAVGGAMLLVASPPQFPGLSVSAPDDDAIEGVAAAR